MRRFVQLTDSSDGQPIYINAHLISAVTPSYPTGDNPTDVYCSGNRVFTVKETFDEVVAALSGALEEVA